MFGSLMQKASISTPTPPLARHEASDHFASRWRTRPSPSNLRQDDNDKNQPKQNNAQVISPTNYPLQSTFVGNKMGMNFDTQWCWAILYSTNLTPWINPPSWSRGGGGVPQWCHRWTMRTTSCHHRWHRRQRWNHHHPRCCQRHSDEWQQPEWEFFLSPKKNMCSFRNIHCPGSDRISI